MNHGRFAYHMNHGRFAYHMNHGRFAYHMNHGRFAYHLRALRSFFAYTLAASTHTLCLSLQHTRFAYTLAASTHTLCLYTCSFNTHALPITSELCGLVDIHTAVRPERGIDRWVRETSRVGLRHKQ